MRCFYGTISKGSPFGLEILTKIFNKIIFYRLILFTISGSPMTHQSQRQSRFCGFTVLRFYGCTVFVIVFVFVVQRQRQCQRK